MTEQYKFTKSEIQALAECERMMDSGEIPFVVMGGGNG